MELEYGFWRLVVEKGLSPEAVESMDLEDMDKALAYMDMSEDYKTAYHEMYDHRMKAQAENGK